MLFHCLHLSNIKPHPTSETVSLKSEPKKRKEPDVVITRLPRVTPTYHDQRARSPEIYVYPASPQSSSPPVSPSYIYAKPQKAPSEASSKGKCLPDNGPIHAAAATDELLVPRAITHMHGNNYQQRLLLHMVFIFYYIGCENKLTPNS